MENTNSDTPTFESVDSWDGGRTWNVTDERMLRATHALVIDGEVYLIDPVDGDGLDEGLADMGEMAGTVVLLDRHKRDADALALRHDVPVYIPEWMDGVASEMTAPVERFGTTFADTYTVYPLVNSRFWQEAALFDDATKTLVVPESVGTASYFLASGERVGIHPMLRVRPPRRLREFDPERLLVGHGEPITENAGKALDTALTGATRRAPALYAKTALQSVFG